MTLQARSADRQSKARRGPSPLTGPPSAQLSLTKAPAPGTLNLKRRRVWTSPMSGHRVCVECVTHSAQGVCGVCVPAASWPRVDSSCALASPWSSPLLTPPGLQGPIMLRRSFRPPKVVRVNFEACSTWFVWDPVLRTDRAAKTRVLKISTLRLINRWRLSNSNVVGPLSRSTERLPQC